MALQHTMSRGGLAQLLLMLGFQPAGRVTVSTPSDSEMIQYWLVALISADGTPPEADNASRAVMMTTRRSTESQRPLSVRYVDIGNCQSLESGQYSVTTAHKLQR